MSELPHYFGLDFSGAGAWVLAGLLAGIILSWIWRALRGSRLDAKAQAQLGEIQALLDSSRAGHQADVARLLGDARNYEQALADAERRAAASLAEVAALKGDNEKLAQAELASRNQLLAMDSEMSKLRNSLQWAETQAKTITQERQGLQQQIASMGGERQNFSAELATARTAAELKDSEIARLINQVQWHENRARALEQEKHGLHGELSRTKGELSNAQLSLANFQTAATSGADSLSQVQTKYDQAWKDLTYMRNLAYWQTSEIDRLRNLVTRIEGDVAAKDAHAARTKEQLASLNAKLRRSQPSAFARKQGPYFHRQGTNGTSADAHAHAKGLGKIAFAHRATGAAKKAAAKKSAALATFEAADGARRSLPRGHRRTVSGKSPLAHRVEASELQNLKVKVAELSEDAIKYRRLREAVHAANRIADGAP